MHSLICVRCTKQGLFTVHHCGRALDREGLTRSSLTISEDGTVVALEAGVCDWPRNRLEQLRLLRVLRGNIIESECLLVHSSIQYDFLVLFNTQAQLDFRSWPSSSLSLICWPYSDHNLHVIFLGSGAQSGH